MKVALSRAHFPVKSLGPGNRVGVWLQGCSIRCPGCISIDTWAEGRGVISTDQLLEAVKRWLPLADGITISGGEPFDQPAALFDFLHKIRAVYTGDILVFSGYSFESLSSRHGAMSEWIDAIISDPFDIDAPQTLALRGSDNQRLFTLTELGRQKFSSYERVVSSADNQLDIMIDEVSAWIAGIPKRGDFGKLQKILRAQGHAIKTSEQRLP